jgi:precorrin-4 methylase
MDGTRKAVPDLFRGKEVHDTAVLVHRTFMMRQSDPEKALKEVERIEKIVRKAMSEGKTVSVVDSGDPTIYGPNMWFMEVFEDLDPEIIPGVSSFNAANAALKKGVTSGETTRSVVLTNGLDAEKLAQAGTTMVFFTMHVDVPGIVKKLRLYYPPQTPVAIVANAGYREKEKIIRGTLDTIGEISKGEELSMYLVYVGDFLTKRYGIKGKKGQADTRAQGSKEESIR